MLVCSDPRDISRGVNARRTHLVVGVVALVAFLMTGIVMRTHEPPLSELGLGTRLLFRSRHIYLMWSASLNVVFGLYLAPSMRRAPRLLQRIGSALVLASPVLLVFAFVRDSQCTDLVPTIAQYGVFAGLGGIVLHLLARTIGRRGSG